MSILNSISQISAGLTKLPFKNVAFFSRRIGKVEDWSNDGVFAIPINGDYATVDYELEDNVYMLRSM